MKRYDTFGEALDALFAADDPHADLVVRREPGGTGWVVVSGRSAPNDASAWGLQEEREERMERGL